MIRGAIFDLDGTLIDSLDAWDTVGAEFLAEQGITPPEDLGKTLEDMSLAGALHYFRDTFQLEVSDEEYYSAVDRLMENKYRHEVPLKPHALEFVKGLAEQGVRCCVATASSARLAQAVLENRGLMQYMDFVLTCDEAGCGKSFPGIYIQALERLGTTVADTVVFEDSLIAIRSAKRVGFRVVAMEEPKASCNPKILRYTADYYCTSFAECEVDKL